MHDILTRTYHVTVKHWRRYYEENAHPLGGTTRTLRVEDLPDTRDAVEITIDLTGIAETLGPKAVRSHGGRSRGLSGLVLVRRLPKPKPPKAPK